MKANTFSKVELPFSEGFRFIAYDYRGTPYRCEIFRSLSGQLKISGLAYEFIVSWTNEVPRK